MRLTILLASAALATPALASGSGYPGPQNPNGKYRGNPGYNHGCGSGYAAAKCGRPAQPTKPPKLVYQPLPPSWEAPAGRSPNLNYSQNNNTNSNWNANENQNQNHNWNQNQNRNDNVNANSNRNSARAGARAGAAALAGATATGGTASIGNVSTGPSTATASNSNTNNANNSSNLSSSVSVEGDSYIQARNRRIPVSTAYAAPLTSGIDTCLGSASAGVQTGILGVSLGGTKRDRICETIKLSRELHHMGMREGAVQLLCLDERVRFAMRNAGTPCEAITYAPPPMVYDVPPPPPPVEYLPPRRKPKRGERG